MRIKRLDALRCAAVFLVIGNHTHEPAILGKIGWIGVDLFFVLSGFLISGLLYSEYKLRGEINFVRFFVRRLLKIYPAFYVLILATWAAAHFLHRSHPFPRGGFLHEILFIQNYRVGVWPHTWSLAVEEHFYIGVALLLLFLVGLTPQAPDPFRKIPAIFLAVGLLCPVLRALTEWRMSGMGDRIPHPIFCATHTRMDSLFFGVFLGYLYHFRPDTIRDVLGSRSTRLALLLLSVAPFFAVYYFSPENPFFLITQLF